MNRCSIKTEKNMKNKTQHNIKMKCLSIYISLKTNKQENQKHCKFVRDWLLVFNAQSTMTVISGFVREDGIIVLKVETDSRQKLEEEKSFCFYDFLPFAIYESFNQLSMIVQKNIQLQASRLFLVFFNWWAVVPFLGSERKLIYLTSKTFGSRLCPTHDHFGFNNPKAVLNLSVWALHNKILPSKGSNLACAPLTPFRTQLPFLAGQRACALHTILYNTALAAVHWQRHRSTGMTAIDRHWNDFYSLEWLLFIGMMTAFRWNDLNLLECDCNWLEWLLVTGMTAIHCNDCFSGMTPIDWNDC